MGELGLEIETSIAAAIKEGDFDSEEERMKALQSFIVTNVRAGCIFTLYVHKFAFIEGAKGIYQWDDLVCILVFSLISYI